MDAPTSKPPKFPDPTAIIDLATAYWGSMVILTANRLGIFSLLARGQLTAGEIAAKCRTKPESLALLLNACVAQGLLEKDNGQYRNSGPAAVFLVEDQPGYLGQGLHYLQDLYPLWGRLQESIESGGPVIPPQAFLGDDPEKTRHFVLAMHNRALATAAPMAAALDLSGRKKLFDVGGGPATYSRLLVEKTPGLEATVLDLPGVVEVGKELLAESDHRDRIRFRPGDYTRDDFGSGNDVVLMSGMLHRETAETCQTLLDKAYRSLDSGGLLAVADVFFVDDSKVSPPFATLFALTMHLTSQHGGAHAKTEVTEWMSKVGFTSMEEKPFAPPLPHLLITGIKP